jgi:hypothetical protein
MDDGPKSAYELAMERLRKQDAEQGVADKPLSDAQKAEIADVRKVYAAKLAQEEILYKSQLASTFDHAEREKLAENYRREVERLTRERESKIERIREG